MNTSLPLLLIFFALSQLKAQFGPQQIISNTATNAHNVISADLDGDTFFDVIVQYEGKIVWYKNTDGKGAFDTENIILEIPVGFYLLIPNDMDGDSDIDILISSSQTQSIFWIENMDGQGIFATQHPIFTSEEYLVSFLLKDINGDNYPDIICSNVDVGVELVWFENINNTGNFSEKRIIDDTMLFIFNSMDIDDIDGDGDNDIVIGRKNIAGEYFVVWYENIDGFGTFGTSQQIIPYSNFDTDQATHLNDMDLDGDIDIVFLKHNDFGVTSVNWIENLDGIGNTWDIHFINDDSNINSSIMVDVNNDNFIDIIYSSNPFNNETEGILWIKNDKGNYSSPITITELVDSPQEISIAFINKDNSIDLLLVSSNDNKIAWYENLGFLSTEEYSFYQTSIFPNPTQGIFKIRSKKLISKVEVFNFIGQKVMTTQFKDEIDLSVFQNGIYLIKIYDDSGINEVLKVIKK
ncbi:MAG: T9SS type A sorting domain-containing protein [Flavobacteriaceae bacterium]